METIDVDVVCSKKKLPSGLGIEAFGIITGISDITLKNTYTAYDFISKYFGSAVVEITDDYITATDEKGRIEVELFPYLVVNPVVVRNTLTVAVPLATDGLVRVTFEEKGEVGKISFSSEDGEFTVFVGEKGMRRIDTDVLTAENVKVSFWLVRTAFGLLRSYLKLNSIKFERDIPVSIVGDGTRAPILLTKKGRVERLIFPIPRM